MRFILGLLVGYCIRGNQRLVIGTLTAIAIVCFIVLSTIALFRYLPYRLGLNDSHDFHKHPSPWLSA
jgi:hypothetical protein